MYRFLLRPWWIVSHLLVAALIVAMISLGLWQLRRLDQKQALNAEVLAATEQPVVDASTLLRPGGDRDLPDGVEYRRVTATGTYLADDEVRVNNRDLDGSAGQWLLTPLLLEDGTAVAVNRGFIPFVAPADEPTPPEYAPTKGEVTVTGLVRASEERGRFGATDPTGVELITLARADLGRLQAQVEPTLLPAVIQLESQLPAAADLPDPLPFPTLSEGPHFSYAMQWFIFTAIAILGYPLVLRRVASRKDEPAPEDDLDRELAELVRTHDSL